MALLFLIFATLQSVAAGQAQTSRNDALSLREHIYKGNNLMQRRDFEGALSEYEEALLVDPSNSTAKDNIVLTHNNWGIELFRQKKYEDAHEQWNMALKLNPYDRNAKNNLAVLKATLAKFGPAATPPASGDSKKEQASDSADNDTKSGGSVLPKGSQTAKEDNTPIPNAVILGHPASGGSGAATDSSSGASAAVTTGSGSNGGSSGGVVILNSGARQYSGGTSAAPAPAPSAPPAASLATPTPPAYQAASPSPAANNPYGSQPVVSMPTTNPYVSGGTPAPASSSASSYSTSTSNSSSLGMGNLEEKLAALETKIYGHSSKDTPILQRLERIERDTSSRASLGSINDRVQTLLKTYGM